MAEIKALRKKIKIYTDIQLKKTMDICEANIEDLKDQLQEIRNVQRVNARSVYKKSIRQTNRNLRNWEDLLDDVMKEYCNRRH